jgi:hypothetical protein
MSVRAAFVLLATLGWSTGPRPEGVETSSGSHPVSAAVVATWIVRTEPRASPELDLLVLWRGEPGWFMAEGAGESRSGTMSATGEDNRGIVVEHLAYGDVRLTFEFDQRKRTARVQDQEVTLGSANVILVDEVDGETGPRVAGSLEVDPLYPDTPEDIAVIIRRSPELYAYLRCDAKLPDATVQTMIDALCERMNPDNR